MYFFIFDLTSVPPAALMLFLRSSLLFFRSKLCITVIALIITLGEKKEQRNVSTCQRIGLQIFHRRLDRFFTCQWDTR